MTSEFCNKEQVLLADGDAAIRKLICDRLCREGYHCLEADTARQALDQLSSNQIELVLLDISMRDKSGLELLPEIKESYPSIKVIMVTAVAEIPRVVQSIKLGADDYMCKPFEMDELVMLVNKALGIRYSKTGVSSLPSSSKIEDTTAIKDKKLEAKALRHLNSIKTPEEFLKIFSASEGKMVFGALTAQRILREREELDGFESLEQIAFIRGIGAKRFNAIAKALKCIGAGLP